MQEGFMYVSKEYKERMAAYRKRHTISAKFNGVQVKILSDACRKSRCSRSSMIRQAVMDFLCVNHFSIVPPELDYVDKDYKGKGSLRFRKLCRSVITSSYFIKEGKLYEY